MKAGYRFSGNPALSTVRLKVLMLLALLLSACGDTAHPTLPATTVPTTTTVLTTTTTMVSTSTAAAVIITASATPTSAATSPAAAATTAATTSQTDYSLGRAKN